MDGFRWLWKVSLGVLWGLLWEGVDGFFVGFGVEFDVCSCVLFVAFDGENDVDKWTIEGRIGT